ncbi:MAG: response regulator [Candidatus Edwardsbacteria bacterium]|nr:response regulator [Candidatus Edwardsbacteria bacterium]
MDGAFKTGSNPAQVGSSGPGDQEADKTILLVEDEKAMREMAAFLLQNKGYAVLTADSFSRAEQLFRENRQAVRLLLTDLVLPDGSGIELHRKLIGIKPELATLIVSGRQPGPGEIPREAQFMKKPFSLAELHQRLTQALERPDGFGKKPPPVCGLAHRFPAGQTDMFARGFEFACCDSRDCPYKQVHRRRNYCFYPRAGGDENLNEEVN